MNKLNELPRPDEALASYEIVKQIVELGFPHNFQNERAWVVDYMYAISGIIRKAMAIKTLQESRIEGAEEGRQ